MRSFLKKYGHKFHYAFQGLFHGIIQDHSIRLQALIGGCVIIVCCFCNLSWLEWTVILAMILLVIAAEFINSTLEELCDALFPEYDLRAKKIKDYAAASVLLFSILAALAGFYVIGGKFI